MPTIPSASRNDRIEPVIVLAAPEDPTGKAAESFLGIAKVEIPEGSQLIAALYGEVKVNPAGTALDRVVAGVEWRARFRSNTSSTDTSNVAAPKDLILTKENGGRIRWTRNDGWPLGKVVVPSPGVFEFGAHLTGAPAGSIVGVMGGVRGLLVPMDLPPHELRMLLAAGSTW